MLKTWITGCLICSACVTNGSAQNSRAIRIYGERTTVMNRKICGYITWEKTFTGQTFLLQWKNREPVHAVSGYYG
ncbi:MAG: hypothetical protein V8R91_01405 [Butyricimonas faecihominis]